MGYPTIDSLKRANSMLKKAHHLSVSGQTHGAVLKTEKALEELFSATRGVGLDVWFSEKENSIRNQLSEMKMVTDPDNSLELVQAAIRLAYETKEKIIPKFNETVEETYSLDWNELKGLTD